MIDDRGFIKAGLENRSQWASCKKPDLDEFSPVSCMRPIVFGFFYKYIVNDLKTNRCRENLQRLYKK